METLTKAGTGRGAAGPVENADGAGGEDSPVPPGQGEAAGEGGADTSQPTDGIAGVSSLKGLLLYGATLTFVGLYTYFIIKILGASAGNPPKLSATTVGAAAGLAGALGSAFALEIGAPTLDHEVNQTLSPVVVTDSPAARAFARVQQALSLQPRSTHDTSWPKTLGIWAYAAVASAVALTYVLNPQETPRAVQALAVAFAGYVLALVSAAYKAQGGK
jgi:hypothetical protein